MMLNIVIPYAEIEQFCHKWQVEELALFGSVLRNDFRPDSDIDILVTFNPELHHTLSDLMTMEEELTTIFRRRVDLGERITVESDPNYIRRKAILDLAQVIYSRF